MLDMLLQQVKNAIFNSKQTPHQEGHDPDGLIGQIENFFRGQQSQPGGPVGGGYQDPNFGNVRPASEDPYGDPADGLDRQFPGIRPASEDPLGDPADVDKTYGGFANVRPASEDPLGDPADLETRR